MKTFIKIGCACSLLVGLTGCYLETVEERRVHRRPTIALYAERPAYHYRNYPRAYRQSYYDDSPRYYRSTRRIYVDDGYHYAPRRIWY